MYPMETSIEQARHAADGVEEEGVIRTNNSNKNTTNSQILNLKSTQRLRWTDDLHECFVNAVTQLGGPEKATPKGIVKAMGVEGLTIYQVKSHLQKYRLTRYTPESTTEGINAHKKDLDPTNSTLYASGLQITEALKLQLEVQKRLQEQMEAQWKLHLSMEAQGEYLKKIIEQQQSISLAKEPVSKTHESQERTCSTDECTLGEDYDSSDLSLLQPECVHGDSSQVPNVDGGKRRVKRSRGLEQDNYQLEKEHSL